MSNPPITINLVIHNGEKYIRQCLEAVLAQSCPRELIELNILDNASTDSTILEIEKILSKSKERYKTKFIDMMIYHKILNWGGVRLSRSNKNLGMWPAQEKLLEHSRGKYVVVLSVDVILDVDFIKNAVEVMEQDEKIGAVQAKIYRGELRMTDNELRIEKTNIIDTLGFKIYKSRRIVNVGHGEQDNGQYDQDVFCFAKASQDTAQICLKQIWAVEGAVPVFRREALEDCRLISQAGNFGGSTSGDPLRLNLEEANRGKIIDPDFFWYGDDLDLAWRMKMFGWKQVYAPNVIAWHDRKTTKALAGGWREFIQIRKTVPMFKRRLDWRNTTLTIIKNDFAINWLRDSPRILWRQLQMWAYFLIFEPAMVLEIFKVAKMLPRMLKRRREIMQKAKVSPKEFRKWTRS